jgi:hypothetical protein
MKARIIILTLMVIVGLVSCKTDDIAVKKVSYLDYLSDKSIIAIQIQNDIIYIFTSGYCDTCYVAPHMSHIPSIEEWTVIKNDSIFENYSPNKFSGLSKSDNKGQVYLAKWV